jgi:filamentous hemagglutinin family protein
MNKLRYKTIFSKRLGALVAVGEHAAGQGKATGLFVGAGLDKGCSRAAVCYIGALTLSFALVSMAWATPANTALPTGGQVAQGAAAISQSGANMAIHQSTTRAVVNWQSFDIGKDAKVNIVQPSAQAVLLNRVIGVAPSQIFGQMTANGQVVLVNPNGVTFGKDGSVSAAGLTASTLNTTDADFMAGHKRFTRDGATGEVLNQGTITAAPGGYVALLGASVSNEGKIVAPQGKVALGAAETITLPLYGSSRIKMELTPSAINAAVANQKGGSIVTEAGQVYLQAAAVGNAIASVMQSGGIDTSGAQGGAVHLLADGGRIKVDGSITANSTAAGNKGGDIVIGRDEVTGVLAKSTDVSGAQLQSKGGFVETSGHYLKTEGISVKAKEWLLDPTDITIVATGTATADTASITASGTTTYEDNTAVASSEVLKSTIESAINGGTNVTIKTSNTTAGATGAGNITIATALAFNNTGATDATLSLIADNGITQNSGASITTNAASTKLVNVNMTANGNYQGNPAASASSGGIVLNSTISTDGTVTLIGTNKNTGGGAGVQFGGGASITTKGAVTVDGTSTSGTGYGVSLNNTLIDAGTSGDIFITGTSTGNHGVFNNFTSNNFYNMKLVGKDVSINGTTSGLNSSGFYSFIGHYAGNIIEAAGNIAITGTTNGTGTGSGLYYETRNWQKYVNSYTAGGSIALSGTNTSASNTAVAVRLFGVQAKTTGSGSVSVNASTQNASVNAIHIYSEKGQVPSGQTQISYQGGASSLVSTSGDIKIQTNQGGILLNEGVPNSVTPTTISGRNISIDNTGGNIDTTSGAISKGSGKSTSGNSGIKINDARAITATGNINLYGVGTSGSGVEISAAAALTAANITINGENTGTSGAAINISHAAAMLSSTQASTLTSGGSGSGTSLVAAGNIQVGTQLTVTTPAVGSISGVISGAGTLLKMGTGKTTLAANNTYTGATAVKAGTLSLTTAIATYAASTAVGSLYSSSGFNIASGATLDFNLPTNAVSNGNATTFTGTGKVTKTGGGTLTWGSGGTNATKFQLDAGSLLDVQAGSVTASSSNAGDWSLNKSSLNIENGASFSTAEANVRVDALTGLGALGLGSTSFGGITTGINNTAAGTYNTTANTATFSGVISANAGVTTGGTFAKTGSGTQILTGTNTYTTTTVNGGTLQLGNGGGTGSLGTGAVTLVNGANLNYKRNVTTTIANTIEGTGNVNADITAGGLIVDRGINLTEGNITLVGANSAIDGVGVKINGYTLQATNNATTGVDLGKVTITGTSGPGTGAGIHHTGNISGSSVEMTGISTGSGAGISMTGAGSIAATSVTLGAGSGTVKSGDIKLQGTSAGGLGVNVNTSTAVSIGAANDVTIEGISTATASQQHGVFLYPANKTVQGKNVTLSGRSVNGNAVQTYSAIKATGGDVNITGSSTGALPTASALSLQGEITADQNVVIKGENTDAGNNNAVGYINKTVQATKGQVDITTSTKGTTSIALQLVFGANLVAKRDVNIKTDTLSIDASITADNGAGLVTVKTDSTNAKINIGAVDVGSATTSARTLGLSNAELNRITAGKLVIGDASNTGGLTVSGDTITNSTSGNLTLQTGGGMSIRGALTAGHNNSLKNITILAKSSGHGLVHSATVKGDNITMRAESTATTGNILGYLGQVGAAQFEATGYLNLTGITASTGNGFYSFDGTFKAGHGITVNGTSAKGQGVGFDYDVKLTNTTGSIQITGTATDTSKEAIGLNGSLITNNGGDIVLTTLAGNIGTSAGPLNHTGSFAWGGPRTNIISNRTGKVQITAGNGSAGNSGAIDGTILAITQNGNGGVLVSTSGTGNVTAPKIVNAGTGDVVMAAGSKINAGDGSGGQVKTVSGNTVSQAHSTSPGNTYIYTGSVAETGLLSNLSSNLANLNLSSFGTSPGDQANTVSRVGYTSTNAAAIAGANGGGTAQVFIREAINLGTVDLGTSTANKTYGDVSKTYVEGGSLTADVRSQMKSTHSSASLNTISRTFTTGAASTAKIKTADLIDALSIAPTTTFDASHYSSSNHLKANAQGYGYSVVYTGITYGVTLGSASANVVVDKKTLTVGGIGVTAKTYDGTKLASLTDSSSLSTVAAGSSVANDNKLVAGDNVSLTGTAVGTYGSKDVAATSNKVTFTGKALSRAVATGADDTSNYNLVQQAQATGDGLITAKTVKLTGTRVYDGTTAVAAADLVVATGVSVNGMPEVLDLSGSGLIASKNVNTDSHGAVKARQLSGKDSLTLGSKSGNGTSTIDGQASNYVIDTAQSLVSINKRVLTLAAVTDSKTYDGTTASSKSVTVSNKVAADSVTASQSYTGKNVAGTGGSTLQVNDTVTIVDGGNVDMSGNYAVSKQGTTGTITAKELTFAAVSDSKVYDGGTSSTKAAIITGKQGDDTITAVQAFASKNVLGAADSTLEVGAVSINDGNDGKNYSIGNKANGNGTISKADLTVTLADQTKTYDGTTAATLVPKAFTVKGVTVAGQTETASVHQTVALYNDKNVLGASSITANLAADNFAAAIGTDLNNYNLPTSVIGKGKITPKDAAVTGTATTVQANGTQQTQSPPTKSGFVAGEDVTVSGVATGMIAGTYNSNLSAAPANAATVLSNYKMAYTNAPLQITPGIVTNSNLAAAVAVALARPPTPTSRVNLLGFFNTSGVAAAMPGGAGGAKSGRLGAAMPGGVDAGAAIKAPSGAVVSPQQACSPENLQQCACKESGGDGIELCLAPDDKL